MAGSAPGARLWFVGSTGRRRIRRPRSHGAARPSSNVATPPYEWRSDTWDQGGKADAGIRATVGSSPLDGHRPPAPDLGACSSRERCPPRSGTTADRHRVVAAATPVGARRRIERVGKLRQAERDGAERCADGRQGRAHTRIVNPFQRAVMRCAGFESPYLHHPIPRSLCPSVPLSRGGTPFISTRPSLSVGRAPPLST